MREKEGYKLGARQGTWPKKKAIPQTHPEAWKVKIEPPPLSGLPHNVG